MRSAVSSPLSAPLGDANMSSATSYGTSNPSDSPSLTPSMKAAAFKIEYLRARSPGTFFSSRSWVNTHSQQDPSFPWGLDRKFRSPSRLARASAGPAHIYAPRWGWARRCFEAENTRSRGANNL
ncbi:hypothetical protein PLEOSDRAFT_1113378, partial [Pleurotus ostreatus PC15]